MTSQTPSYAAFRVLEQVLVRRRLRSLELSLRLELAALGILIGGFLFWQARVPLDGLVRGAGPVRLAGVIFGLLSLFALAAGGLAAARQGAGLARVPPGPSWLALPVEPPALARHLAWNSSAPSLLLAVPAAAVIVAGIGLLPAWWLVLLAAAFTWMLIESSRSGCAMALWLASRRVPLQPGLTPLERVLASPPHRRAAIARGTARWRRLPPWIALAHKDLLLSRRSTPAANRAPLPLLLGVLSVAVWWLPMEPHLRHFVAFALGLLASTTGAEWLISVVATDPFPVLRNLPIGVGTAWGARFVVVVLGTAMLVLAHAAAAHALAPGAHAVFLVWLAGASLAIGLLGVNYGITLYPRAEQAQRMLVLSLALAMVASVMIPLLGWVLLLTAVLHSARRVAGWNRLEAS